MTDTAVVETPTAPAAPPAGAPPAETPEVNGKTPDNPGFLDLSDLPEEKRAVIEKKFAHLTWKANEAQRGLKELGKAFKQTREEFERFRTERETESVEKQAAALKAAKVEALEKADYGRVADIDERLAKLSAPKAPPQAPPPLPPADEAIIQLWANQVGSNGQFVRPWAQPEHPDNARFTQFVADVAAEMDGAPMARILAEVDKRLMEGARKKNGASPPATNTRPGVKETGDLTPAEKQAAIRMLLWSKTVKSEKEAFDMYAKMRKGKK